MLSGTGAPENKQQKVLESTGKLTTVAMALQVNESLRLGDPCWLDEVQPGGTLL